MVPVAPSVGPEKVEPFGKAVERTVRAIDGRDSLRSNAKKALRPPATLRRRISSAGLNIAFCFQSIERGIDGADRHLSSRSRFDLPPDSNAVRLVMQT